MLHAHAITPLEPTVIIPRQTCTCASLLNGISFIVQKVVYRLLPAESPLGTFTSDPVTPGLPSGVSFHGQPVRIIFGRQGVPSQMQMRQRCHRVWGNNLSLAGFFFFLSAQTLDFLVTSNGLRVGLSKKPQKKLPIFLNHFSVWYRHDLLQR